MEMKKSMTSPPPKKTKSTVRKSSKPMTPAVPHKGKPKLHTGNLMEMELTPATGRFDARQEAAEGRNRKVVWVTFRTRKITTGEFKGGNTANIIDVMTGENLGYLDPKALKGRRGIIKALGKVTHATCFLELDDDGSKDFYRATVRFGKHEYMPRKFW